MANYEQIRCDAEKYYSWYFNILSEIRMRRSLGETEENYKKRRLLLVQNMMREYSLRNIIITNMLYYFDRENLNLNVNDQIITANNLKLFMNQYDIMTERIENGWLFFNQQHHDNMKYKQMMNKGRKTPEQIYACKKIFGNLHNQNIVGYCLENLVLIEKSEIALRDHAAEEILREMK